MPGFKLHALPMSVSCLPIEALAQENGIEYEMVMCDLMSGAHKTPEFLAMNPMHCVPTMDDDGFHLWEGRAIARYVCYKHNLEGNYPSDPKKRALIDNALDFHMGVWYKNVTCKVLYPPCGFAPAPSDQEMKDLEKAFNDDYWPTIQKFIKEGALGAATPTLADFFFVLHLEYTKMTCPNSFVAKHSELMAYSAGVKAKLSKWSNWSGPADGFYTSKKA
mmetsp:Transcript_134201/g.199676  ORF Transcript_134201/g.199676 Transcript_134201/m.199676 type:complete len:219 (-) Transcript_134201:93-749(-)|eukprot:CAMPEP_0177706554 /NCGR_PEP_ID=MMETSP0484_2-20121128/9287_1 /TAXON_ID=354590 /ORGANISM="Rhodomonas lens, Strain RHODO" /LENGTH=218 /DNA_ID=CAMNT_0019218023 /DNA_START=14 /DNA_END=670 /DNA_ORIENTATION=-